MRLLRRAHRGAWLLIAGLLIASPAAQAQLAARYCEGTIANLLTYANGDLTVDATFRGTWIKVCNVNTEWGGITPKTCQAWMATLITARQMRSTVMIFYDSAPACNALPTYGGAPPPGYVGLIGQF